MAESTTSDARRSEEGSVKETLISLIISFVMALVFRSYVVEAFIIPTGSMAPTLLGAHMRFQSEESGYAWAVNPWYYLNEDTPFDLQRDGPHGLPSVTDPMSTSRVNPFRHGGRPPVPLAGYLPKQEPKPLRAGDRILVQKYLYNLFPPKRFDVVVFKNPELSTQNFIKRLIGLPNEQLWIADGDVFARPVEIGVDGAAQPKGEWRIARKPDRVQDALWRPIYSSEYAPLNPVRDGRTWFVTPWRGEKWQTEGRREYRCDDAEGATLAWDSEHWPIHDWVAYNEYPNKLLMNQRGLQVFPTAELRMRCGVKPDAAGATAIASIEAWGHEFQAVIGPTSATIRMRPVDPSKAETVWRDLGVAPFGGFEPGRITNVEFWHVDQSLQVRIDGDVVARAEYNWSPSERLLYATGTPGEDFTATSPSQNRLPLADTYAGTKPTVRWVMRGAAMTLYRVGLDRDIYYEAARYLSTGEPALGTHPKNLVTLGPSQYFVMGDNSPSSKDGRLWDTVDPWVADQIDDRQGIVPEKLILGKAFFVYFPAPERTFGNLPIPDFGRMRWIR